MKADARRAPRSVVSLDPSRGVFLVNAGRHQFRLREVNDVSPSGASLCVPAELAAGSTVTLTYSEDDWHVTVIGDVVWTKPIEGVPGDESSGASATPFRIGVAFRPTQPEENALFFLALRQRLDPFTWA